MSLEEVTQIYFVLSHGSPPDRLTMTTRGHSPTRPVPIDCAPKPFLQGGHPTASAAHSLRELGRHSAYALAGAQSVVLVRLLVARLDARSTSINQSEASCQKQREFNDLTFVFGHYSTDCKPQILRRQPASDGLINRSDQTTSTPSTTLGRTRLRTES